MAAALEALLRLVRRGASGVGRFNISRPPQPPPRKMTFQYLPALPPSDEMDRLKAVKGLSAVDPFWDPKSRELVRDAARQLGTCFAALSLFDRKHEIVRAGSGYSGGVIPRRESIGAHLMLGSGPMVILDTRDDWRFEGHPLVRATPYIRFYAAAPLTTQDGHPVGALAVFDTQPRAGFSLEARSALGRLAAQAWGLLRETAAAASSLGRFAELESGEAEGNQSSVTTVIQYTGRQDASTSQQAVASSERSISPTHMPEQEDHDQLGWPGISIASETADHNNPDDDILEETSSQSTGSTIRQRTPERQAPQLLEEAPRPPPLTPRQRRREAHYLMSLTAHNLGWDYIYLVRVLPGFPRPSRWNENNDDPSTISSKSTPSRLPRDHGKKNRDSFDPQFTQLIVSHGYHNGYEPPSFSVELHLRALRSASGLMFRNQGQWTVDGSHVGYEYGLIIPLTRDGFSHTTSTTSSQPSSSFTSTSATSTSPSSSSAKRGVKEGRHRGNETSYDDAWICESGYVLGAFQKKMPPPLLFELEDPFDETVVRVGSSGDGGGIGGGIGASNDDGNGIVLDDDESTSLDVGIGLAISHDPSQDKNQKGSKSKDKGKGKARAEKVMTMIREETEEEDADAVGEEEEEEEEGIIWGPTDEDIHSLTEAGKKMMEILYGE